MSINTTEIKGFELIHTIKGRSTTTRFSKKEFSLFKEWVRICENNGFDYKAYAIDNNDRLKRIGVKK